MQVCRGESVQGRRKAADAAGLLIAKMDRQQGELSLWQLGIPKKYKENVFNASLKQNLRQQTRA